MVDDCKSDSFEVCRILSELSFDGQQTLVTPESFNRPNIRLVHKILWWLLKILTLGNDFTGQGALDSSSSDKLAKQKAPPQAEDYVAFLQDAGKRFYRFLGVRLDLVALCRADRSCCAELLKVAEPIFEAAKLSLSYRADDDLSTIQAGAAPLEGTRAKCRDLLDYVSKDDQNLAAIASKCNQLSSEIQLLLEEEEQNHCERLKVVDRRLELEDIERVLASSLEGLRQETQQLKGTNAELEQDIERLEAKLGTKELEVMEARQKLNELLVKAPSYANQYEALKRRYDLAYERYVSNYRNLAYLKSCLYSRSGGASQDGQDDDCCTTSDDDLNDYQVWLDEYYRRLGGGGGGGGFVQGDGSFGVATQLDGEGTASKPSAEKAADRLLLLFDGDEEELDDDGRLLAGCDTVGPARLLESLLDVEGTSNPRSASLATAGPRAPESVELIGAAVEGRAGTGVTRGRNTLVTAPYGRRTGAEILDDTGLELEGLLDEFALDESKLNGAGCEAGSGSESADGTEEEDEEEEDEDEDDLVG